MKIEITINEAKFSFEHPEGENVSVVLNAKGRTWRYTVIGEVPVEERDENILVKTAVDTRFSRFDGSLERVFEKLTQSEKRTIANHFGFGLGFYSTYEILDVLLQEHTYTEIRTTLRRLLG